MFSCRISAARTTEPFPAHGPQSLMGNLLGTTWEVARTGCRRQVWDFSHCILDYITFQSCKARGFHTHAYTPLQASKYIITVQSHLLARQKHSRRVWPGVYGEFWGPNREAWRAVSLICPIDLSQPHALQVGRCPRCQLVPSIKACLWTYMC